MLVKKLLLSAALLTGLSTGAHAADAIHDYNFQQAVARAVADGTIDNSVKFYLHGNKTRQGTLLEKNIVTNQKTNAFGKSADVACDWVLRSALKQLHSAAKQRGGNAVINISSYFKKNETVSPTTYRCHKGMAIASVALKGDIVKQ